ncbi:MAG TPA: hypothetical protein DEB09_02385 [Candidatus Magasanikbacteria bacterium]|nr:hypothetical protein [Candidatus Magasanikbacteria bacterium]
MGIFKKGLLLGGLLGAGLMWLNTTKKGKEMRDEMLDHAAEVYVKLKEKILTSEQYYKLTKNEYVKMVQELVNKYAIDNGLAENIKKMVEKLVVAQWSNLKGQMKK